MRVFQKQNKLYLQVFFENASFPGDEIINDEYVYPTFPGNRKPKLWLAQNNPLDAINLGNTSQFENKQQMIQQILTKGCTHKAGRDLRPGGRLNKKDGLTRYGNSHVKDKTS